MFPNYFVSFFRKNSQFLSFRLCDGLGGSGVGAKGKCWGECFGNTHPSESPVFIAVSGRLGWVM